MEVKGYCADAKGCSVDVKGYIVYAKDFSVDVEGYSADVLKGL